MKEGGTVKFGGNQSGKIIGTRTIGNSFISINNVWLVDDVEHNLLSISQFCDNGYDVMFGKTNCTVIIKDDNSIVFIEEEVFVKQPPIFEDLKYPDHVYKLKKSLYGLKQAPRAWYDRLSNFLIKNDFKRGQVDTTLFRRTLEKYILVVHIYVDDIIFGSTNASFCKEFSKLMQDEFEMSMMAELKFFLGIQVN